MHTSAALRVSDAAVYIGVSRATIYALLKSGELPRTKIGHRTVIRRDALDELTRAGCALPKRTSGAYDAATDIFG
jgi:excisionase family DNA binding protein